MVDDKYNEFISLLNSFNQTSLDYLGFKLTRNDEKSDAISPTFSKSLAAISRYTPFATIIECHNSSLTSRSFLREVL